MAVLARTPVAATCEHDIRILSFSSKASLVFLQFAFSLWVLGGDLNFYGLSGQILSQYIGLKP